MKTAIAVTGDSHFDGSPNGRLDETIRLHDWMTNDWRDRGVGLVLHAGDLFEGLGSTDAAERQAAANFLVAAGAHADVLVLRGNHDPLGELPLYEMLSTTHGSIMVAEDVRLVRYEEWDVEVVCVPWPRKGLLMAEAAVGNAATLRESIHAMMRYYGSLERRCARRVVLAHAMICGAMTSTGQPLVGTDCEISLEDLALAEPDAIFLGHIHLGQQWSVVTPNGVSIPAIYTGSNRRTSFGETEEKRYLLVDEVIPTDPLRIECIPIPVTPMLLLEAAWTGQLELPVPLPAAGPAEVRLRVTIPNDQRDAARGVLAATVAECALRGVVVTVEEIPVVVQRARAPEIALAADIATKVQICWMAKGTEVDEHRSPRVLALAQDIDICVRHADPRERGRRGGGVRLLNLQGVALGPFGEFHLDLEHMRGPLVAICGPNGSGKSTLLECFPGLAYRTTLTRDPLAQLATSRDSLLEGEFLIAGERVHAWHAMDRVSEKGESSVKVAGECFTPGGKNTEFDRWAEQHMPPLAVFEASQFTAQGSSGFLGLGPAKRKDLIQRALGIDGIEARAVEARFRCDAAKKQRDLTAARLDEARTRSGDVAALDAQHAEALLTVAAAETQAADAQTALDAYEARCRESATLWSMHRELAAEWKRASDAHAVAAAAVHDQRRVVADAEAAAARLPGYAPLEAEMVTESNRVDALRDRRAALVAEQTRLVQDQAAAAQRERRARTEHDQATLRLATAKNRQANADSLRSTAAGLDEARARRDVARVAWTAAQSALAAAREKRATFGHERAGKLRTAHEEIVRIEDDRVLDGGSCQGISQDAIDADDAGLAAQDPAIERGLLDAEARAQAAAAAAEAALSHKERAEAQLAGYAGVDVGLEQAERDVAAALAALNEAAAAGTTPADTHVVEIAAIDDERRKLDARRLVLNAALATRERDRIAAEDIDGKRKLRDELLAKRNEVYATITAQPVAPPPAPDPNERMPRMCTVSDARKALLAARDAAAKLEQRLDAARNAATDIATMAASVRDLTELAADLALLAETFGRAGIQALEVDAAGPELSAIVNDLLRTCFGDRWTVRLDTTRQLKTDPTRSEEVFSVRAIDGRTHEERDAGSLSGGEKVAIGEAISLALTVLTCARTDAQRPTLVRDESGAALDPVNAKGYVAMLRRAAERVGADHVLLVSHNPEIQALCDTRVRVGEGAIHVE